MLKKTFFTAILTTSFCAVFSQSDSSGPSFPKISGSADVYYRYNFANPKDAPYNNYTSFTNSHNSFELGMASLKAEHSIGKVGMVADLGFGRRAEEFSYNDANTMFAIKQLYVTYNASSSLKFTFGSWATHVGYELVDAYLNRNYSMGYAFSYGPFFHTGMRADISLGGKNTLMLGVANPTDLKSASDLPKTVIGQFATASSNDKVKAYFNYQGGKYDDSSRLYQGDVVLTYAVSDKFNIGLNGTYQTRSAKQEGKWSSSDSWWASALYLNVDPSSLFGLTLRTEYFNNKKDVVPFGGVVGFGGNVFESTLSANFRIDNLTIIPELRYDNSTSAMFVNKSGDPTKSTASFILAATYHF